MAKVLSDGYLQTISSRELAVCLFEAGQADAAAEDLACVLSDLGRPAGTAHLMGAVDAHRERTGNARPNHQQDDIREPVDRARAALGDNWQTHYDRGAAGSIDDAVHGRRTKRCPAWMARPADGSTSGVMGQSTNSTAGKPTWGSHQLGELFCAKTGVLRFCTAG